MRIKRYGSKGHIHSNLYGGSFAYAMEYKEWLSEYGQMQYNLSNLMCLDQSIQKVSLMNSSHLEPVAGKVHLRR